MIKAFCGRFGSGKTLSMVAEASYWLPRGVRVVSNTPLKYRWFQLNSFKDFLITKKLGFWRELKCEVVSSLEDYFTAFKTYTNTIFVMDEAGAWLNSYKWEKIEDEVYMRFIQVRKINIHLLYTAQFFNFVAKRVRQITDVVVECNVPVRSKPNRLIPYDQGTPIVVRNLYYNPLFYEQKVFTVEMEQKFIEFRKFIWGFELGHAFNAFDTKLIIK